MSPDPNWVDRRCSPDWFLVANRPDISLTVEPASELDGAPFDVRSVDPPDDRRKVMIMDEVPALDAARGDQYAQIEARLVDEYGPGRGAAVRHVMAEERGRFTGSRIRAFVPILVERSVRTRLGTARRS